jgi:GT2 family glycosyltransferase
MKVTIVCAYNTQVEMTKKFLDTMNITTKPFRHHGNQVYMILVNGGCSTKIEHPFINERIDLDENNGFAITVNSGLNRVPSDSNYIFYVGNDSFALTTTWLEELIELQKKTGAGIVCPANDRPGMEAYRHKYTSEQGDYWTVEMFPSIAYLITKECFDTVGLWDPLFGGAGMYGDDDYCMRTRNAGYSIVVSKNIMLQHLLSQEIKTMNVGENMQVNGQKFREKWQI